MKEYNDCVVSQDLEITKEQRMNLKNQKPITIWFTGLSGSGKSTLANLLDAELVKNGKHTMLLDGDNLRQGLCSDLGFSLSDRAENIRRVSHVAKLMNDAGLIVIVCTISPIDEDRKNARKIISDFVEIYVSTPFEECKRRDVKGLYQKAENNEITNFTGIQSLYEIPQNPDVEIDTMGKTKEESFAELLEKLSKWI